MTDRARSSSAAETIIAKSDEIARQLTARHFERHAGLDERYGQLGRRKCTEDAHYHLRYLAQAIRSVEPALFADYLRWARAMLDARGIPAEDLRENIVLLETIVAGILSSFDTRPWFELATAALDETTTTPSFIDPANPHGDLVKAYLDHLLSGSRAEAAMLILNAAESGVSIRDLYLDVFRVAQYELGRLWQINQISVAEEHYSTAATQLIMSQLYPRIFDRPSNGLRLVSATIGGELHEIGARMLADLFELEGWDTYYLGANVPIRDLVQEVASRQAHLVCLSVTMSYHVDEVARAIAAIRSGDTSQRVKVLVGGHPFRIASGLWKEIGADGFSMEADEAVTLARELVGS